MVRTLLIIAAAGLVLMAISFGAAAGLGGRELMQGGWTIPLNGWDDDHVSVEWSGPTVERTLEWSGTDTLTVAVPADVVFNQGPVASVQVRGPQDALDRLTLVDGRLAFDGDAHDDRIHILGRDDGLTIAITAPDVSRFVLEGYGDLDLNAIDRETLEIVIEGAGDVRARGRAANLNLVIEGAGEGELDSLAVENADIRIEGAGGAELNASQSANVVINGVGRVEFLTRPARLTQELNGVGSVDFRSE